MTSSSPQSDLSKSESFYSAPEGNSTTASSPIHENPCQYRSARQLPIELKLQCSILLEEQIFINAIHLLNSLLATGVSRQLRGSRKAIPVPPTSNLALLATLTVHPFTTTQSSEADRLEAASQALDYLRNLLSTVGPINANFRTAFQFLQLSRSGRRSGRYSNGSNSDLSDGESNLDDEQLDCQLANKSSLWQRGQDFWTVFGWAMRCSALYPKRWRYWRSWLDFMLDAMWRDWDERERVDRETHEAGGNVGDVPLTSRRNSIIAMYLEQQSGRRGSFKAIFKALFSDGGQLSNSLQEVFYKEHRGPQKASRKRKRETVNVEKDKFGDYFEDDALSSGASEPPTPQKPRDQRKEDASFGTSQSGLSESVWIRLELFRLLSLAVFTLQREDLADLYEEFAASIKVLPLPLFSLIVSQRDNPLLRETHITLLRELFRLLTPATRHTDPSKVDPEAEDKGMLSVKMLQVCWAPHYANTLVTEDNAKLSLVVESALQLLWQDDQIFESEGLINAVMEGVKARDERTKRKRSTKNKTDPVDAMARDVLNNSAERLHILLDVIEATCEGVLEGEPS